MNERIKLLAEQAQIRLFEDKSFGWSVIAGTDQHLEKFAQLIVKECCQKLESDGMVEIAMEIKEYFGNSEPRARLETIIAVNQHSSTPKVLPNIAEGIYPNRFGYIFYPPAGKEPK